MFYEKNIIHQYILRTAHFHCVGTKFELSLEECTTVTLGGSTIDCERL